MTPDVLTQLEALTNTVAQQFAPFMLIIIAGMVGMSFFVIRFGNRLMASFDRNATEDDKRIDTFGALFSRQVEINDRLSADNTARGQVQLEQSTTLTAMLGELKAMRIDLKTWPELTASEIQNMRGQIASLEQSVALLLVTADKQREDVQAVRDALLTLTAAIDKLVTQLQPQQQPTVVNIETTHNDAAA